MKIESLYIFCCLVLISMATPVLSEENQMSTGDAVSCEQQAVDMGFESGEEMDNFIADCESRNSDESMEQVTDIDMEPVETE